MSRPCKGPSDFDQSKAHCREKTWDKGNAEILAYKFTLQTMLVACVLVFCSAMFNL